MKVNNQVESRTMDPIPEQELSVQVTNVDRVHVDDMDILEAHERQVRQNFASQSTRANDQNLALLSQETLHLHSK